MTRNVRSAPSIHPEARLSLRREVLVNLGVLVVAALSLAVVTALVVQIFDPRYGLIALLVLIAADAAIVFAFGRYLLDRLVLKPVNALKEAAEQIAAGDLERRAPRAETRELDELARCFDRMTERLLDAQGQLVQSAKLATVGRLAAGVAHEIGNPLAAISTYLEVLKKRDAIDSDLLGALRREAERIDRIVRSLLDYAKPQAEEMGPIDLVELTREACKLLERQGALKNVDFRAELDPAPLIVRVRAHAMEQVVVNLVLNAVDAAPTGPIVVGVTRWCLEDSVLASRRRTDADGEAGQRRPRQPATPWRPRLTSGEPGALLYVADSGPGVPEEEREKIFEPFYTTKDPGRGTGLGLAIVQRTVHELGGLVWVDPAREGGAAFKVFLPLAGKTA
jgi:signal transduction histidine kinase